MITVLQIENRQPTSFLRFFLINKLNVETQKLYGVTLRRVRLINRRGKINWHNVGEKLGMQRGFIVCADDIRIPRGFGIKKFRSAEFSSRMSANMLIKILQMTTKRDIKVGLYDPEGAHTELLDLMLRYVSEVKVFTENQSAYMVKNLELMEDFGVSVPYSKNQDFLYGAQIVLAPEKISHEVELRKSAVVLTVQPPACLLHGNIYYSYCFDMPEKYIKIKPPELSKEYFASALYTLEQKYKLGSIVPDICKNQHGAHTLNSIVNFLLSTSAEN